ncbi:response regulator [Winogradskyella wichelsiae]|uniref:response regulator n=1 Tax=Winogradskyella wichelsiae TaxID=2697007 RepID=UPI0015CE9AAC|nr:response regulator [Winogradskyella wichelsiae]
MRKIDLACIIDDDPIFIFGAKRMMELSGFCNSFIVFKNGEDAINNLKPMMNTRQPLPDIILLDINMPIMDGWQFLDEFIQIDSHKEITIYIASSSIDPIDLKRAERYENVSNYIIKPISLNTLKRILGGSL